MYPQSSVLDKANCLSSLVGIRTACPPGTIAPPYFLEDIEGLDVQKLSKMAKASDLKGKDYGNWVIGSAAREMMGDIELLMNNGFSLKNIVGDTCSTCSLLPTYTQNAGIVVKSASPSQYGILMISRLTILTNVTGTRTIKLDDGIAVKTADVTLQAGALVPVNILINGEPYQTTSKRVVITFTDMTVGLGQVYCEQKSGCGCGGGNASATSLMVLSGIVGGVETATQFGFLPCVGISCSYDALVCGMIKKTPNIFGLALLYKIGEKYIVSKANSERNNDAVSFNDQQQGELVVDYGRRYWAKMKGTGNMKGIKNIINDYLSNVSRDTCIECKTKVFTSTATG